MGHFEIGQWSDYARGMLDDGQRRRMSEHLERGCRRCGALVSQMLRIQRDAGSATRPPRHAVRAAVAIFAACRLRRGPETRRLPVEIVFDSLLQPAVAGVRNLGHRDRHLVFNSRQYTVDTRMDYGVGGRELSLVGQIVTRQGSPVSRIPAFVCAGDEIVSQATTSSMGEFHMVCAAPVGELRLCLSPAHREVIEVELDRRSTLRGEATVADWDFRNTRPC